MVARVFVAASAHAALAVAQMPELLPALEVRRLVPQRASGVQKLARKEAAQTWAPVQSGHGPWRSLDWRQMQRAARPGRGLEASLLALEAPLAEPETCQLGMAAPLARVVHTAGGALCQASLSWWRPVPLQRRASPALHSS